MAAHLASPPALRRQPGRRDGLLSPSRGVVLIFALLALVVLSLGCVALVRSVGSGAMLLGNLGMKQDATRQADIVTQQVIANLATAAPNITPLQSDGGIAGYYASVDDTLLDATGQQLPNNAARKLIAWTTNCSYVGGVNAGNCNYTPQTITTVGDANTSAQYVVFRLCSTAGPAPTSTCALPTNTSSSSSSSKGAIDYGHQRIGSAPSPYYRIIVRVAGSRNAVSYTETLVHF